MKIELSKRAEEEFNFWKNSNNQIILKRIKTLLEAIEKNPYEGIGKPEKLKYSLSGLYSRRINKEHRVVYTIDEKNEILKVYSLRFHY